MESDEQDLRQKARDALRRRVLPGRRPDNTWGGPGNGAPCAICGKRLAPEDMVFDLEFAGEETSRGATNFQVHVRCFAAWEFERETLQSGPEGATLPRSERTHTANGQRE